MTYELLIYISTSDFLYVVRFLFLTKSSSTFIREGVIIYKDRAKRSVDWLGYSNSTSSMVSTCLPFSVSYTASHNGIGVSDELCGIK
jgi:hypothetical protein